MAEVVADLGGSLGLGFFIQWKQLVVRGWQLIDADSALAKDVLTHGDSGHRVRPSCVKRKVRDDLGELAGLHSVIQCQRKVKWHLDRLDPCDEGRPVMMLRSRGDRSGRFHRPSSSGPFV